ncbi:MAG: hypothetical protein RIF46_08785, partial [Cyclobacteriaceae bacterium]
MRIPKFVFVVAMVFVVGCNPVTIEYPLIYTDEDPNHEFAFKLKEVLEDSYNVNIRLVKAASVKAVVDSLEKGKIDMGLIENLNNLGSGIQSLVPVYPKVFHLFYKEGLSPSKFQDLFYEKEIYIGLEGSASYNFIMSLFDYYRLDVSRIRVTSEMAQADVLAIFSVIMSEAD